MPKKSRNGGIKCPVHIGTNEKSISKNMFLNANFSKMRKSFSSPTVINGVASTYQ